MGGFAKTASSAIPSFAGRWGNEGDSSADGPSASQNDSSNASSSGKRNASAYEDWALRATAKKAKKEPEVESKAASGAAGKVPQSPRSDASFDSYRSESLSPAKNGEKGKGKAQPTLEAEEDADLWDEMEPLPPPPKPDGEPLLSAEQQRVFDMIVKGGRSLMFTGGAGTGKSVLLRAVVKELKQKYGNTQKVAVCAMTGIAALHVGGQTLHSWAGIGLGNRSGADLVKSVRAGPAKNRWLACRVLLVDEVSMLDAVLFDKLDYIAKNVRNNQKPFGGIQLVMVGDFYQLPPVVTQTQFWGPEDKQATQKKAYNELLKTYKSRFVFDAKQWNACIPRTVVLQTVFRQADPRFVKMLEETRRNALTRETIREFQSLSRELDTSDGILPTELYPTRAQVSNANESRLRELPGKLHVYMSKDRSFVHEKNRNWFDKSSNTSVEDQVRSFLDRHMMVTDRVELKEGAQVMLVKNLTNGLVNGSRGRVIGFQRVDKNARTDNNGLGTTFLMQGARDARTAQDLEELALADLDQFNNTDSKPFSSQDADTKPQIKFEFEPEPEIYAKPEPGFAKVEPELVKAEPGTIVKPDPGAKLEAGIAAPQLKAPSMTLEEADKNRAIAQANANVEAGLHSAAGSNGRLLEIAVAAGKKRNSFASDFGREGLEHAQDGVEYPIVQFVSGQQVLMAPQKFEVESQIGELEAFRVQVPLILAWSMSIHKAQGQTLDKVKVNLTRTFEAGQAYVALSRATHLGGIQVLGFKPEAVRMDINVMKWERNVGVAAPRVWAEIEKEEEEMRENEKKALEKEAAKATKKAARKQASRQKEEQARRKSGLSSLDPFLRNKF